MEHDKKTMVKVFEGRTLMHKGKVYAANEYPRWKPAKIKHKAGPWRKVVLRGYKG